MSEGFTMRANIPEIETNSRMLRLLPAGGQFDPMPNWHLQVSGSSICELDVRFEAAGVWAGVSKLIETAYLNLLEMGEHDIIQEHDYELYLVLAEYRDNIRPRYLCLTDTAVAVERTRFYPLERAYRLVHGLAGMVLQWRRALQDPGQWSVVVRNFDHAQHLARRFVVELARRGAADAGIAVFIETGRDPSGLLLPGMRAVPAPDAIQALLPRVPAVRPIDGLDPITAETDIADGDDTVLEARYPSLLECYHSKGDGLSAARLALRVLSLYNRRGYYHEAKSFIDTILPHFDQLVGGEEFRRMNAVSELNSCLVATGDGERAMRMVADLAIPYITKPHLLANMHYMLAMHHLRYIEAKDVERAEYHILQAVEYIQAAKTDPQPNEHAFLQAFIHNGLAFLRVRQKRHQEALELCRSAYQSVTGELGESRHLLHRSVLRYNMAQVYVMLGRLEDALECYDSAISMDPFYTEYLLESGNILQQLDRSHEALEYYARAIECSPPYPEVYLGKAISHAALGQWLESLICSGISLELHPNQPDLHAARAEIFAELGQPDSAVSEYDKAIAQAPDSIAMRVNRAVLHFNSQSYDEALTDMNEVIARDAHEPAHYENRAAIYRAINRQELYQHDLEMAERCKALA